jgi:hypothetical protein
MPKSNKPEDIIEGEVLDVLSLEKQLQEAEMALMQVEAFVKFTQLQKDVAEQTSKVWKQVERHMIEHDVKSLKGDWGSITIAERQNFKADIELLPNKFIKKTADTSKIATYYTLEGKLPAGVERSTTKYLTKRLK